MSWYEPSFVYQVYPLGLCGAPHENDGVVVPRLRKLVDDGWIDHMERLGATCLMLNPVFQSLTHGYDTTDYTTVDCRLGTNDDLRFVVDACHKAGIRVLLDGVFNHVGRSFGPYRDVVEKKDDSPYRFWFSGLQFGWGNPLGDPCTYNTWGGDWNLVKLELGNPDVRNYLLQAVGSWMDDYGIDGLRLDTADVLHPDFIRDLNHYTKSRRSDFWLMGEFMNCANCQMMGPDLLDSITNYECWKGMYSSVNSKNYFEISYGINRQTNPQWGMYKGKYLYNFLDNHDQPRIASQVTDKRTLKNLYTMLLTMPGIPSVYYGSEWGMEGRKGQGAEADYDLRKPMTKEAMEAGDQELMEHIAALAAFRKTSRALQYGSYTNVCERNEQLLYERACDGETVLIGFNIADAPWTFEGDRNGKHYKIELAPFDSKIVTLN